MDESNIKVFARMVHYVNGEFVEDKDLVDITRAVKITVEATDEENKKKRKRVY